mgnify:CR=1 FL=1
MSAPEDLTRSISPSGMGRAAIGVDVAAVGLHADQLERRRRAHGRSPGRPGGSPRWRNRGRFARRRDRAGTHRRARGCSRRRRPPAGARPDPLARRVVQARLDRGLGVVVELGPRESKNLIPLSAKGLWEAETTAARSKLSRRASTEAAGVGRTPPSIASPPPAAIPAARASSSIGPDSRVSRTISTCGRSAPNCSAAARPRRTARSGVSSSPDWPADAVGPEQFSLRHLGADANAWRTGASCGPS